VRNAIGQHPRLARSGTGHNHHRSFGTFHRAALYAVKFVEVIFVHRMVFKKYKTKLDRCAALCLRVFVAGIPSFCHEGTEARRNTNTNTLSEYKFKGLRGFRWTC
jgi:hypothetical protein